MLCRSLEKMTDANLTRLMKQISSRMVQTAYRLPWQFRLEISEAPANFEVLVKEISQEPFSIQTDTFNIGSIPFSIPNASEPITLTATCYDTEDEAIYRWFESCIGKVVNQDGTFNHPAEYLLTCKIYRRMQDGTEVLRQNMRMIPLKLGALTESFESKENLEFPLTFVEFRGGGIDY